MGVLSIMSVTRCARTSPAPGGRTGALLQTGHCPRPMQRLGPSCSPRAHGCPHALLIGSVMYRSAADPSLDANARPHRSAAPARRTSPFCSAHGPRSPGQQRSSPSPSRHLGVRGSHLHDLLGASKRHASRATFTPVNSPSRCTRVSSLCYSFRITTTRASGPRGFGRRPTIHLPARCGQPRPQPGRHALGSVVTSPSRFVRPRRDQQPPPVPKRAPSALGSSLPSANQVCRDQCRGCPARTSIAAVTIAGLGSRAPRRKGGPYSPAP